MNKAQQLLALAKVYWSFRRQEITSQAMPVRLWIEPTSWCNLRCPYCPQAVPEQPPRGYMDLGLFEKIVDEARGFVYDVNLTHRGESTFHKDLCAMVRLCRERGIRTRIHTNATILNTERVDRLLDAAPDLLSFSFDGYDKATYERNRVNGKFEKTLAHIEGFLRARQGRGAEKPYTVFQVIEMEDMKTPEQREKGAKLEEHLRGLGLDKFYRKRLHNWAGHVTVEDDVTWAEGMGRGYVPCTFPWYAMTIFWDGRVSPCPQDYFEDIILGDCRTQTLPEIWNGEPMRRLREEMASRRFPEGHLCPKCDRLCQKAVAGVPVGNLKPFLTENLLGYEWIRSLVKS
ncbi:MAG: radical SAM/SPASM domain-containing protein [bacterium]